jgi:hypothetical protein
VIEGIQTVAESSVESGFHAQEERSADSLNAIEHHGTKAR